MLKKTFNYLDLVIASINLIILTTLLALWTDKLELIFNDFVRPIEFLKILGFSLLSLIAIRVMLYYFKKKNIYDTRKKLKSAILLSFLISSYLYVDYSIKIVKNIVINREFRNQITTKIKPVYKLAYGTKADNLNIREYQEISNINWFPKLPLEATNIKYSYEYDSFLPDYSLSLIYDLPKEMKVEIINYKNGDFSKSQTFEVIGNNKHVTYNECEQ